MGSVRLEEEVLFFAPVVFALQLSLDHQWSNLAVIDQQTELQLYSCLEYTTGFSSSVPSSHSLLPSCHRR